AITAGQRMRGVDCLTCEEDGTSRLADDLLLAHATALARVLFSEDIDLYVIASDWMRAGGSFAGLVFARQTGISIGQAVEDLHFIAQVMEEAEIRNNIVRIPL